MGPRSSFTPGTRLELVAHLIGLVETWPPPDPLMDAEAVRLEKGDRLRYPRSFDLDEPTSFFIGDRELSYGTLTGVSLQAVPSPS